MLLGSYSIIMQNDVSLIIRFSLILFFVINAYYINSAYLPTNLFRYIFVISFPVCLSLIIFEVLLFSYFDDATISFFRHQALNRKMGDIYFSNFYYKIQLKGLAILPFIYMLSYVVDIFPYSYKQFFRFIYLLAILIAGNFAYMLAILFFHSLFYFTGIAKSKVFFRRICLYLVVALCVAIAFVPYALNVLEEKKDFSNALRIEQASLLIENMGENVVTFVCGQGLGNTLDKVTSFRDYREDIYYELQVLYFLNQLGTFPFLLFLIGNIVLVYKFMPSTKVKVVYLSYVFYAVTNPYIMDTTQVFVIIMLLLAQRQILNKSILNEKNNMCISYLQS